MGKIEKIIKKGSVEGQTAEVYPVTSTKAVYDENNKRLDNIITGLQESVYLKTPIPISTDNTPESIAQNVKNIADYVEKAKAAGIADVNGMGVTCLIDNYFSGVGYIMGNTDVSIQGIKIPDDIVNNAVFTIVNGRYDERFIVGVDELDKVTSNMLVQGARRPIILTTDTTEVDEETYQKLLSDNVDVVFKAPNEIIYPLYSKEQQEHSNYLVLIFAFPVCLTGPNTEITDDVNYTVRILPTGNHSVTITQNTATRLSNYLSANGYVTGDVVYKNKLTPILQEIDLTGTDMDRKTKLYEFRRNWEALTGASDLNGARFIGVVYSEDIGTVIHCLFSFNPDTGLYSSVSAETTNNGVITKINVSINGSLIITPLFSHLEAITISIDNTPESKAANIATIKAYVDNLKVLGVDTTKGFNVPVRIITDDDLYGCLTGEYHTGRGYFLSGTIFSVAWGAYYMKGIFIAPNGQYMELVNIKNDNGLSTTSKNLIGAINEVNTLAKKKQDKLTSGTNIKTINNQSLLGSGNIEISAPSITVDTSMSDTSMNPVQNKVIKAYIDRLVGNVTAQLAQI